MKISNGRRRAGRRRRTIALDVVDGDVHGVIAAGPPDLVGVARQHRLALERLGHVDDAARRSRQFSPEQRTLSTGAFGEVWATLVPDCPASVGWPAPRAAARLP